MENIKIEITEDQIRNGIEKCISEALKSSYSNPVNDAVNKALKNQDGLIVQLVNDIIANAIATPEFKTKLGEIVLGKMIELALNKSR